MNVGISISNQNKNIIALRDKVSMNDSMNITE